MVKVFENIRKISYILEQFKNQKKIDNFKVILKLNMSIDIYVLSDTIEISYIEKELKEITENIEIEIISQDDFEHDNYYKSLFDDKNPDLGLRRSLSNVIDYDNDIEIKSCPIVSFYSYKGGVGRTTALASFASHYANKGKKVFVIDCDFEAPGLINFFDISNEENPKNGIVEYIKDKEADKNISIRDNYVYEVSRRYTGEGQICILSAGNIFEEEDRNDYLEALGRLDIHSTSTIVDQFKDVITDINKEYLPDVILIDSRTGFNDIFGILANKLSDVVVGFFGNNTQNKPGLYFFLNTLLRKKKNINLIGVLSLISGGPSKREESFRSLINDHIQNYISDDLGNLPVIPICSLLRNSMLEDIGTEFEEPENFLNVTKNNMLPDYVKLFNNIINSIESLNPITNNNQISKDDKKTLLELKSTIIEKLEKNYPQIYAEDIEFNDEFINSKFFIRKCMEDIFNEDKFILLGGKGTGKTAFYKALNDKNFFTKLKSKAQKEHLRYDVIKIISFSEDLKNNKFIDIVTQFKLSEIKDYDYFFNRFWKIFIWNSIRLEDKNTGYISLSNLEIKDILDDTTSASFLRNYIENDELVKKIEKDLSDFNNYIKSKDRYIMLIFDNLDKVVKPVEWHKAISPLIKFCLSNNYNRLFPKLFIRRDLFEKLTNLTNKQALASRSINLEWEQEELFAFFFKVIFSSTKKDFFDYANLVIDDKKTDIRKNLINEIEKISGKQNSFNQLQEEYYIKPLVEIFFGKEATFYGKNFGEMYDWIYLNLKNADDTINLRPFLDFIKFAIESQKKNPDLNKKEFPLIVRESFNQEVRKKAIANHFNDLADEEGNEILRIIINDIKENKIPKELQISPILQRDFERMINNIKVRHDDLKNETINDIEQILKINGIIFITYIPGAIKKYTFAYLYKYYLGLRSPDRYPRRYGITDDLKNKYIIEDE